MQHPELPTQEQFESHWDGHHMDDTCPWVDPRIPDLAPVHWRKEYKEAQEVMTQFAELPKRQAIRSFVTDTFDATKFPEGSVVRLVGEIYTRPNIVLPYGLRQLIQGPFYEAINEWGVVVSYDKDGRQVTKIVQVRYYPMAPQRQAFQAHNTYDPFIQPGEIYHFRRKDSFPPNSSYQRLERFQRVELWGLGNGRKRRIEEPSRVFSHGQIVPKAI